MSYSTYETPLGNTAVQSAVAYGNASVLTVQQEIEAFSQDPVRALALRGLDNEITACNHQLAYVTGRLQELLRQRHALVNSVHSIVHAMQGTVQNVPQALSENYTSGLVDSGKYDIEVTPGKVVYTRGTEAKDNVAVPAVRKFERNSTGYSGGKPYVGHKQPVIVNGNRLRGRQIEEFVEHVRSIASQVQVPNDAGKHFLKNYVAKAVKRALRDGELPVIEKEVDAAVMLSPETTAVSDSSVDEYAATVGGVDYTYSQLRVLEDNGELPEPNSFSSDDDADEHITA